MIRPTLLVLSLLLTAPAWTQVADTSSPAERRIAAARRLIESEPQNAGGYAALATALARRARETSDPDFYRRAEEAVSKALELEPGHFEARKTRVRILLGKHEFAAALNAAQALNTEVPDDVLVYGYLVDAYVELGRYDAAEKAAQWMLDLRPGNIPALTRAAYLRELFGDIDGAIELMQLAYNRTPQTEVEDRAWIATQLGHLEFARGRRDDAVKLVQHALEVFPGYHYALLQLAKLRVSEKRIAEAIELHRRHVRTAPHPENYYALGVALIKAGRTREGRAVLAEFEAKARAEMKGWDNANRELVMYYVDQAGQPARALHVAQLEADRRNDVFTLEALAWAHSAAGQQRAARAVIERALAVGIRDAGMFYRAGVIAQRQGDRSAALDYFSRSLDANPRSEVADLARRQQIEIGTRQERTPRIAQRAAGEAAK